MIKLFDVLPVRDDSSAQTGQTIFALTPSLCRSLVLVTECHLTRLTVLRAKIRCSGTVCVRWKGESVMPCRAVHTEHFSDVMHRIAVFIVTAELERVKRRRLFTIYPFEVR